MTIGIYKLMFEGTDKVYIGQSINIEKRLKQHIAKLIDGTAPRKLQLAYNIYGLPKMECLVECDVEELTTLENLGIELYDSFHNGLNSIKTALDSRPIPETNSLRPVVNGTKYSSSTIISAFHMLVSNPNIRAREVSEATGINISMIKTISRGKAHLWLRDLFPEQYAQLISRLGSRNGAAFLNTKYPPLVDPEGGIHNIVGNLKEFTNSHKLNYTAVLNMLAGRAKSTKGWKILCQDASQ